MTTTIVDWNFTARRVANPDGSRPIDLPASAPLVDGPGGEYPKAVRLATSGISIPLDNLGLSPAQQSQFHMRVVFRADQHPNTTIIACLPSDLYLELVVDAGTLRLGANIRTTVGISTQRVQTYQNHTVAPAVWHNADLIWDADVLFLALDDVVVGCHAFAPQTRVDWSRISSLALGPPSFTKFKGDIAGVKLETGIPPYFKELADGYRSNPQYHITRKLEILRPTLDLGKPKGPATKDPEDTYIQEYDNGILSYHFELFPVTSPGLGGSSVRFSEAHEMHGQILAAWREKKAIYDFGFLRSDQTNYELETNYNNFSKGVIYAFPALPTPVPTPVTIGVIGQIYRSSRATDKFGQWGRPRDWQKSIIGGVSQEWEKATWFHKTGAPQAYPIETLILEGYNRGGGMFVLGFPVGRMKLIEGLWEDPIPGSPTFPRIVYRQDFEKGAVVWSRKTGGAKVIAGEILKKWDSIGGIMSRLGLPVSISLGGYPSSFPGGEMFITEFEHGLMTLRPNGVATPILPFQIFLGQIGTAYPSQDLATENDVYADVTITDDRRQIFSQRFKGPDNTNNPTFNVTFPPILVPKLPVPPGTGSSKPQFSISLAIKDHDSGPLQSDDVLGSALAQLGYQNDWGQGEMNRQPLFVIDRSWIAPPGPGFPGVPSQVGVVTGEVRVV